MKIYWWFKGGSDPQKMYVSEDGSIRGADIPDDQLEGHDLEQVPLVSVATHEGIKAAQSNARLLAQLAHQQKVREKGGA